MLQYAYLRESHIYKKRWREKQLRQKRKMLVGGRGGGMNDLVSNTGNNISKKAFFCTSRHAKLQKFLYIKKRELIPLNHGQLLLESFPEHF